MAGVVLLIASPQSGQHAAGAGRGAAEGVRHPRLDRRQPAARGAAAADRGPGAGAAGRAAGAADFVVGDAAAQLRPSPDGCRFSSSIDPTPDWRVFARDARLCRARDGAVRPGAGAVAGAEPTLVSALKEQAGELPGRALAICRAASARDGAARAEPGAAHRWRPVRARRVGCGGPRPGLHARSRHPRAGGCEPGRLRQGPRPSISTRAPSSGCGRCRVSTPSASAR